MSGFKSANLIGTINSNSQTNLSIISSFIHAGSNPPCFACIFRPPKVERHTFENIIKTKFFTVNHVSKSFIDKAHQTSARYPRDFSEFHETQLTEEYLQDFYAPFVKESPIKLALEYEEHYDIKLNNTVFLLAKLRFIYIAPHLLNEDGFVSLDEAGVVCISGLDSYHSTSQIVRLPYAKP